MAMSFWVDYFPFMRKAKGSIKCTLASATTFKTPLKSNTSSDGTKLINYFDCRIVCTVVSRYAGCRIEDQCSFNIRHHSCIATCHLASPVTHPMRCHDVLCLDIMITLLFAGRTSCVERSSMTEVCRGSRRCFMLLTGDQVNFSS